MQLQPTPAKIEENCRQPTINKHAASIKAETRISAAGETGGPPEFQKQRTRRHNAT
jgi:hypothetical protein